MTRRFSRIFGTSRILGGTHPGTMPSPRPPLAASLVQARISLGLRQEAMAERLGISRRTLSRWEQGHITPTLDDRVRVLAALGDAPLSVRTPLGVAFGLVAWQRSSQPPMATNVSETGRQSQPAASAPTVHEAINRGATWLGVERAKFEAALLMVLRAGQAHGTTVSVLVELVDVPDVESRNL